MTRALTLPQPIPECVLRRGQRVLRRAEPPDVDTLGGRIALHAAQAIEPYHPSHRFPLEGYVKLDIPLGLPRASVVATARVVGFFEAWSEASGGRDWVVRSCTPPLEQRERAVIVTALTGLVHLTPWWGLSGEVSPIDLRDAAAAARGETFVAGSVRAFGWVLDEVVEIDPPVATTQPMRAHVHPDGTWELGRVAEREVSMREEYALEQRAQTENAT